MSETTETPIFENLPKHKFDELFETFSLEMNKSSSDVIMQADGVKNSISFELKEDHTNSDNLDVDSKKRGRPIKPLLKGN